MKVYKYILKIIIGNHIKCVALSLAHISLRLKLRQSFVLFFKPIDCASALCKNCVWGQSGQT